MNLDIISVILIYKSLLKTMYEMSYGRFSYPYPLIWGKMEKSIFYQKWWKKSRPTTRQVKYTHFRVSHGGPFPEIWLSHIVISGK